MLPFRKRAEVALPKLTKQLFQDFWQFRQYLPRPFLQCKRSFCQLWQ